MDTHPKITSQITPEVSVCIATYNRADQLVKALDSVFAQDMKALEVVVVDDASTDATEATLQAYQAREPRLLVHRVAENLGPAEARNRAIRLARAPCIAILDSDDVWCRRDKLRKQRDQLLADDRLVVVGTHAELFTSEGKCIGVLTPPCDDASIRRGFLTENPFVHSSVMFRRDAFHQVGEYSPSRVPAEDYELFCQLLRIGCGQNLPMRGVRYTVDLTSLSRRRHLQMAWQSWRITLESLRYFPRPLFGIGYKTLRLGWRALRSLKVWQ